MEAKAHQPPGDQEHHHQAKRGCRPRPASVDVAMVEDALQEQEREGGDRADLPEVLP